MSHRQCAGRISNSAVVRAGTRNLLMEFGAIHPADGKNAAGPRSSPLCSAPACVSRLLILYRSTPRQDPREKAFPSLYGAFRYYRSFFTETVLDKRVH